MKKLLLLGWLTVIGLSFAPASANAWWLHNCCCHHKYSMKVCITPYNAFSPICAGNFCCVGCNPFCDGPQQPPPPPWWANAQAYPPLCNSNCCESGCLPSTVPGPTNGNGTNGNGNGNGTNGTNTSSVPTVAPPVPSAQGFPAAMPYGIVRPANAFPQGYNPNYYNTVANPYNVAPTMPVPNFNYQSNYNPYAYGMNPYANTNPYANMNPYGGMNPYANVNPYGR